MKINVSFGRYGEYFFCASCGQRLKWWSVDLLFHPKDTTEGVFRKAKTCLFSGVIIKHPFQGIEASVVWAAAPKAGKGDAA